MMKIRSIGTYFSCLLFLLFSNVTVVDTLCSLIHSAHNHQVESSYHFDHHPGHDRHHQHDNMPDHEPHGYNHSDQILQTGKKVSNIEIKNIFSSLILPINHIWESTLEDNHFVFSTIDPPPDYFFQSSLLSRAPPLAIII